MSKKRMQKDLEKRIIKTLRKIVKYSKYSGLQSDLSDDISAIRDVFLDYDANIREIKSNLEKLKEVEYLSDEELMKKLALSIGMGKGDYLSLLNNIGRKFKQVFHPTKHSNYYTGTYLESKFVDLDDKVRLEKVVDKIKVLEEEFLKKELEPWDKVLDGYIKAFRSVSYKYDDELIKYMLKYG